MIYHRCLKFFECPVGHSKIPDLQELSNQYVHHHDFFHTEDKMNFLKHTELSIFCPHLMAQRITLQVFQGVRRYNSNDFFPATPCSLRDLSFLNRDRSWAQSSESAKS